jgi:hypothetical protein
MENVLRKGHSRIISQIHSIHAIDTPSMHPNLQYILSQHQAIFNTPHGIPPSRNVHDNSSPLFLGIVPPNIHPFHHPFSQKNENEKIVQELLEAGVIHPSTSPYSSLVVMVLKKEGTWCMCSNFSTLNKLTIKDKLPILVIDDCWTYWLT